MCSTFCSENGTKHVSTATFNNHPTQKHGNCYGTLVFTCLWDYFIDTTDRSIVAQFSATFSPLACLILHFNSQVLYHTLCRVCY